MNAVLFRLLEALQFCGQSKATPRADSGAADPTPELPERVKMENAHAAARGALREMGLDNEDGLVDALERAYQTRLSQLDDGNSNSNHDPPVFI